MLLLFAAVLLLLFLPMYLTVCLRFRDNALLLRVELKLPLLKAFRLKQMRVTAASFPKRRKKKRKIRWKIVPLLKRLRGHVRELSVFLRFGTGDAASTACLAGQLYGFFALFTAGKPERKAVIEPVFQEKTFFAQGKCMIRTSLIHAIISVILSAKIQKSAKK